MHVSRPVLGDLVRPALLAAGLAVALTVLLLALAPAVLDRPSNSVGDGAAAPAVAAPDRPTPAVAPDWVRDPLALPPLTR